MGAAPCPVPKVPEHRITPELAASVNPFAACGPWECKGEKAGLKRPGLRFADGAGIFALAARVAEWQTLQT